MNCVSFCYHALIIGFQIPSHFFKFLQVQELLSNISVLEFTVAKLEQEMVSLHFQLSQERNERRLAEYRLRHSSPHLISPRSTNVPV